MRDNAVKMLTIFRRYYIPWIVVFSFFWLLALFGRIRNGHATTIFDIIEGCLLIIIFAGLLGGIHHLFGETYRPWRTKKMVNHEKLRSLVTHGFIHQRDVGYHGEFRGFLVYIQAEVTTQGEWITLSIPIQIHQNDLDAIKKLSKTYELRNTDQFSYLVLKAIVFLKIPDPEKILKRLEKFTDVLLTKNIKPDSLIDT
jgi:hypothetical protein